MKTFHLDRSAMPKVTRTPEGFLRGEALVTRAGVFEYQNQDGSSRFELRHPDDVLNDSLASLRMVPITVNHPNEPVTVDNAAELSVGTTGEYVQRDGNNVIVPLTITHADGIAAVESGKQELSLGYSLELVQEDGEYEGQKYTHRQKNICYNHLAIVDVARAGKAARLNLDGASVQVISTDASSTEESKMLKINIDGLQYDAAPEVDRHIQKLTARADEAEAVAKTANARADKAEAEKDAAQTQVKELQTKLDGAEKTLGTRVKARIDLVQKASRVVNADELYKLDSDTAIMSAALKARHNDINLDGKSDDYVAARFDAMIDALGTEVRDPIAPNQKGTRGDVADFRSDQQKQQDAYVKGVQNLNAWRDQKSA